MRKGRERESLCKVLVVVADLCLGGVQFVRSLDLGLGATGCTFCFMIH